MEIKLFDTVGVYMADAYSERNENRANVVQMSM